MRLFIGALHINSETSRRTVIPVLLQQTVGCFIDNPVVLELDRERLLFLLAATLAVLTVCPSSGAPPHLVINQLGSNSRLARHLLIRMT